MSRPEGDAWLFLALRVAIDAGQPLDVEAAAEWRRRLERIEAGEAIKDVLKMTPRGRPMPYGKKLLRVLAVGYVNHLIGSGSHTLGEALKVAEKLTGETEESLKHWRKDVASESSKNSDPDSDDIRAVSKALLDARGWEGAIDIAWRIYDRGPVDWKRRRINPGDK